MKTKPTIEFTRPALHDDAALEAEVLRQLNELNFGQELATLRKRAGLTQQELAEELGVSQSFVAKLESGKNAELKSVLRVAAGLGKKVVLSFEDVKKDPHPPRKGCRALPKRSSGARHAARRG